MQWTVGIAPVAMCALHGKQTLLRLGDYCASGMDAARVRHTLTTAALVALAVLAAPAAAGQTFNSKVTIEFNPSKRVSFFSGKVKSNKPACVDERVVALYRQRTETSKPKRVGSDEASVDGTWGIEHTPVPSKIYFAKIKPVDIPGGECKRDTSPKLTGLTPDGR